MQLSEKVRASLQCERTKKVHGALTPRSPLVDADSHAFCQAIYRGIEGQEWEAMSYHDKDLHHAVKSKKPGDNKKASALCARNEAKDRERKTFMP